MHCRGGHFPVIFRALKLSQCSPVSTRGFPRNVWSQRIVPPHGGLENSGALGIGGQALG